MTICNDNKLDLSVELTEDLKNTFEDILCNIKNGDQVGELNAVAFWGSNNALAFLSESPPYWNLAISSTRNIQSVRNERDYNGHRYTLTRNSNSGSCSLTERNLFTEETHTPISGANFSFGYPTHWTNELLRGATFYLTHENGTCSLYFALIGSGGGAPVPIPIGDPLLRDT